MKRFMFAAVAAITIAGCAAFGSSAPKSPDQALFAAHTAYVASLTVVTNYSKGKPICPGNTWAATCANGPFLIMAKHTSDAAATGLDSAQPLVNAWKVIASPSASDTAKAMAAVNAAGLMVQAVGVMAEQIKAL